MGLDKVVVMVPFCKTEDELIKAQNIMEKFGLKRGENKIEVMIYNILANNYTTVPTRYRGAIKSGIIGPVNMKIMSNK